IRWAGCGSAAERDHGLDRRSLLHRDRSFVARGDHAFGDPASGPQVQAFSLAREPGRSPAFRDRSAALRALWHRSCSADPTFVPAQPAVGPPISDRHTKRYMKTFKASIDVMPHDNLLDPQGKAVSDSMQNLGLPEITGIRIGKHITLKIEAKDKKTAEAKEEEACKKLLANQVMEKFSFVVEEA